MLNSKIVIQLLLFLILILSIFIFINKYFIKSKTDNSQNLSSEIQKNKILNDKNIIKDVKYVTNNENGDLYVITAEYGEFDITNSSNIFMTNVKAEIDLIKSSSTEKILLFADFAEFNNNSFETIFKKNVKIFSSEGIITGDTLHLTLDLTDEELKKNPNKKKNLIKMSDNIYLKKSSYNLKADFLELDLITKDIKIYMKDNKKIKIKPEINVSN